MTNNTTTNGMFNMFALDAALQAEAAEIVDLSTPKFISFGEEWDAGLGTSNLIPISEKQVVKDEGVRTYKRSQAFQDDIDAEIFKKLFFQALNEDSERSGLFTKQVKEPKPKKEGRNKPVKIENLRGAKPGYSMAEGTNWWSVDEKDPYWQTKAGYKEAMDLYGTKPSWVKEPSLEYNPKTGKYDPIEKEVFVNIQPTKRISL
jgi:hypothetical protein